MLDKEICQEMDHIHIFTSILYTRVCTWFSLFSYMNQCHIFLWLSFAFIEGVNSFKWSASSLSPVRKNSDDNEQNTQALLFYCKTYNLGALGTIFFIIFLFTSRRDFKGYNFLFIKQYRVKIRSLILEIHLYPLVW